MLIYVSNQYNGNVSLSFLHVDNEYSLYIVSLRVHVVQLLNSTTYINKKFPNVKEMKLDHRTFHIHVI